MNIEKSVAVHSKANFTLQNEPAVELFNEALSPRDRSRFNSVYENWAMKFDRVAISCSLILHLLEPIFSKDMPAIVNMTSLSLANCFINFRQ